MINPASIPLSLYVHLPWCVRKCPYCDFNSHELRGALDEAAYVDALVRDLAYDGARVAGRTVQSIFLGGGTPSLFAPASIARLLAAVRATVTVAPDAEITLEANPGTVELARFRGYRDAGVNRLSIGIQSFDPAKLTALGRIHGRAEALSATEAARAAGFDNFNLDLMYGLPDQTVEQAIADVETALALTPTHLSVYQLTLEPNTAFYAHPPPLPDDDTQWAMQEALQALLHAHGYEQYEVSAYARAGYRCRHNLNYWEFGDYLGIGAGAHAKLTDTSGVTRLQKTRHPRAYLSCAGAASCITEARALAVDELVFEFMLNAMRLTQGFTHSLFTERTGLPIERLTELLQAAHARGLIATVSERIAATALGQRFLNDLLLPFLPNAHANARVFENVCVSADSKNGA